MLGALKEHIASKIKLILAIDNRLLKITFFPETLINLGGSRRRKLQYG